MVTPRQIHARVAAEPFVPFHLKMMDGRSVCIRDPEMLKVGKTFLMVFHYDSSDGDVADHSEFLSLSGIVSLATFDPLVEETCVGVG